MAEATVKKKRRWRWIILRLVILFGTLAGFVAWMVVMPGASHTGPLPALTPAQQVCAARLRADVEHLAGTIGERSLDRGVVSLARAAEWLESRFAELGDSVVSQTFTVGTHTVRNLEVERRGTTRPEEIVLLGAHYDTVPGCPGADDNTSGCAALLELARQLQGEEHARTLRFVAFVNEEPPYFETAAMGSRVYAERSAQREEAIVAMLSLETLGYYDTTPGSQRYPSPFDWLYPDTGDFIAFVGELGSRSLVRQVVGTFRDSAAFPSEGVAAPGWIPGIDWSDHASFSRLGFPAVMVTDTAPFRNPHYHQVSDRPDSLDYERFARVVEGLAAVVRALAGE